MGVEKKTGRPTLYKKQYCKEIVEYFKNEPQAVFFKRTYYADGTLKSEDQQVEATEFPTFQGFAALIGVHVETLRVWRDAHKDFAFSYAMAKQLQEKIWLINSMSGHYNSQFARFFGKNCLGYVDKCESEVNGDIEVHLEGDIKEWAK